MNEYYYYSMLTDSEKAYYRKIMEAIRRGDSLVKAGLRMSREMIMKTVSAVNYDHPEFFYVDFRHLNFTMTSFGVIYKINYYIKNTSRQAVIDDIEQSIQEVVDMAHMKNMRTDFEICRLIHNYLVTNIRYNYDALRSPDDHPKSYGIDGVFKDKLAVCEGISKAFKLLCDRLAVRALIAIGTSLLEGACAENSHAWNIVWLEGKCSHIDVTWDINMSKSSRHMRFDYFCLPDSCMCVDHTYEKLPRCETDQFSYFRSRGRWFSGSRQLQAYLDSELKKGASVLYFKVENRHTDAEALKKKICDQIKKTISAHCNGSYHMEMIPNEAQLCFFFRIKR